MTLQLESILDRPVDGLDVRVWKRDADGGYVLTDDARDRISDIVSWACGFLGVSRADANITGSITSNTYKPDSDIDVHISSPEIPVERADAVNKALRKGFDERYKVDNRDGCFIGEHPIEVYFQSNPFQDLMSVGCYSLERGWLVGPEMKGLDYDPYDEYYEEDMGHVRDIIDDVRSVILRAYESAVAYTNSGNEGFRTSRVDELTGILNQASGIFRNAREFRKAYSSPRSEGEALRRRNSKEWKIADSAFKLLDKFGYLRILKTFTQDVEDFLVRGIISEPEFVRNVVDAIRENFGNNGNLTEDEMLGFGNLDESFASALGKLALIGSMLAVPEVTDAKTITKGLAKIPRQERRIDSPKVQSVIRTASNIRTRFAGLSYCHLQNLMATIIYNEAMVDYVRFRDERCLVAIANVIENRAGGDPVRFASTVMKKDQFYSRKHVKGGITDRDYITFYPYGGSRPTWTKCNEIAKRMLDGTLENVIGDRNMIANKSIDNDGAWESWGNRCDLKIGRHTFGYEPDQDGFRKYGTRRDVAKKAKPTYRIHTVKSGDTITKIAKAYGTTVDGILRKNSWIKNVDRIMIGQKLRV